MSVKSFGVIGAASTTKPKANTTSTIPQGRRRRLVLLAVAAGLALGGLVGLLLGPHSLVLGPRFSGDPQLAADFRATLESDRGLASVEVARLRDGKVTYAGLAPAGTDAPTPQTPFELGSITKTMTGMLLADAVQRGEMRGDAPVSDYLPELVGTPAGAATLDQLANHHSGLPALPSSPPRSSVLAAWSNGNPNAISVGTLLRLTRDTPLGTPGRFAYSNLGMSLLGHAEARAAGAVNWPALARQRLLVPLGMTNTTFVMTADQIPDETPTPRKENGWWRPHWYGEAFAPAGTSTVTTAEDVMKYTRAVVEGKAPGLMALEPVAATDAGRIGLAWMTFEVSGRTLTWHNGGTGGYRSMLAVDRQTGQAVLVLNSSTRWVDDPGLQLAAAASPADLEAALQPGPGLGTIAALPVGVVLLGSGAAALLRLRHRIAAVRGAVNATAGLVMLRVHGPWALVPAELWAALAGLVLASVIVGSLRFKAQPAGPERHRWASIAALGFAVLVLLALAGTA
jgi:CubicO group peptidase (beta-lactamase class C family)